MKISEIKSKLSLETVLGYYKLTPDKQNRLLCPFHDDKTPSLQLYPNTGTWNCFSINCEAGNGDVIDFIMRYDNITKHEAIKKASSLVGETPVLKQKAIQPKKETTHINQLTALKQVFDYFQTGIRTNCKEAHAFLEERGLNRLRLEIGYNSGQFHYRENKQYIPSYQEIGLLNKNKYGTGYIPFAKYCIMFPLKNAKNEIVSFYGRSIMNDSDQKHFYLKNTQGLYPHYPNEETKKLIITECIIDAATLLPLSIVKNYEVLASYGTNRLTTEHIEAIQKLSSLEEIILWFDGDEAGRKAVKKYSQSLHALLPNLSITYVVTPENEDINSLYVTYDEDCLVTLLNERKELYTGKRTVQQPPEIKAPTLNVSNSEALVYDTKNLTLTVLGGIKVSGLERMKVTLKIQAKHNHYDPIRHTLDLYNNNHFLQVVRIINEQLEVSETVVHQTLLDLIEELEKYRIEKIEQLNPTKAKSEPLTLQEVQDAETYLKSDDLMQNTFEDLGKTGIVGEEINRFVMYLVFLSRITPDPLHIVSFGASGTGKTHLQERIALLLPEEDKIHITALSPNALYYFQGAELQSKVIVIEDMDGAKEALYSLRELKSKQEISKMISIKDQQGKIKTIQTSVKAQVSVAGCTTKPRLYEDNANRSILLYMDSSKKQDERIMKYQKQKSAGTVNHKEEETYRRLLKNVQRILKPVKIINPYAPELDLPTSVFKKRRSNWIYLRFIEVVTLYNQYRKEKFVHAVTDEPYIETSLEDITWANKLITPILLRKSDELTEATRNFFEQLKAWLSKEKKEDFKTRELKENLSLASTTLNRYLAELIEAGLVKIVGGKRARGFTYEVTSYEEYQKLKHTISQSLDGVLNKLKRKAVAQ